MKEYNDGRFHSEDISVWGMPPTGAPCPSQIEIFIVVLSKQYACQFINTTWQATAYRYNYIL